MRLRSLLLAGAAALLAGGLRPARGQEWDPGMQAPDCGNCPAGTTCFMGVACIDSGFTDCAGVDCGSSGVCVGGSCMLTGAGDGDPILKGFDGRSWEFLGEPGKTYALYSDAEHAVNMRLFLGQMHDHNGTYIGGIGFQHREQRIAVELLPDGSLKLSVGGSENVSVRAGSSDGYRRMGVAGDSLAVAWSAHQPALGRAVTFATGTLRLQVWAVPPGLLDAGGWPQPAYLNFQATLLGSPPGDEAQGLIGETLMAELPGAEAGSLARSSADRGFHGRGSEADYETSGLFDPCFKFSLFRSTGSDSGAAAAARRQMLQSSLSSARFPAVACSGCC